MEFGILGPLEARSGETSIELGPPKQRALLALLLLQADRVVPTDRILEELWGDDAAGKEKALWVHISRLRSALEPHRVERGQSSVLVTRDHGYMIRTDPSTVDAHRFEAAVAEARARLGNDPAGAAALLREALSCWRGSALQDFTYEEFARPAINRLEDLRLDAIELRVEADLRLGRAAELVGELEALVEEHPLRERPVAQLMRALYRSGRQAEALRAFQRHRVRIGEELGLEPSPGLRRLEEQVLLHDERLAPPPTHIDESPPANPFKGLHAFQEADAGEFFGRDRLVVDVLDRLRAGGRLIALVGPSGSGKSSVARAGVVPAVRKGALTGSERWLVASMVPGSHPFAELEAALLRTTIDAPDSLAGQLADPTLGVLRAALRLLPDETTRLLLVIDQFEELFILVEDEAEGQRFLANLVAALDDPRGRVLVLLTLRADSYHRPLAHPEFARRLGSGVVNVLPLTTDELEEAAEEPARRRGVVPEPALLAELLTDVIGEPGALPLFQYALTELFERRQGDRLTVDAYRSMGGVRGVLSRRADDLYHQLSLEEQEAARQLFLRLATITESDAWSRRRVPASELVDMDVDVVTMEAVIDRLGRHRFLAFDRDHGTGAPTVEVAHEALLHEWDRLRGWIEEGRGDVTRRAALDAALTEWRDAERDRDYLLGGKRLAEYERWRAATTMRLTSAEQEYLDLSTARRDQEAAEASARAAREAGMTRRARRRSWALAGLVVAVVATGSIAAVLVFVVDPREPPRVALVTVPSSVGQIDDLMVSGLERAARDFDIEPITLSGPFTDLEEELGSLVDAGTDLVLFSDLAFLDGVDQAVSEHPDTTWAYIDISVDGAPAITFAEHEGAYLAGAAAALTTTTGTIGYVGGFQYSTTERFRAGFEAGARAVDPTIEILATYSGLDLFGFTRSDLAEVAATEMYRRGADVVLHAAGAAGRGVFDAAREQSGALGRHLWAIGADSDQYFDVPVSDRPHVLTSTIKRFDVAVYEAIRDFADGGLDPIGRELGLADQAVGYSTTGGHLPAGVTTAIEALKVEVVAGRRAVPRSPSGALQPPPATSPTAIGTVTFDGTTCAYDGPTSLRPGSVVHIEFVNTTLYDARFELTSAEAPALEVTAGPNGVNEGYAQLERGTSSGWCATEVPGADSKLSGPTFDASGVALSSGTPAVATDVAASVELAGEWVEAFGTFDADRTIGLLADGAITQLWESADELRSELAHLEATGYRQLVHGCKEVASSATGITVSCDYDLHLLGSEELGLGPYSDNYWELTIRDGEIVAIAGEWAFPDNGFNAQVWEPFAQWISTEHADDVAAMYSDSGMTRPRLDDASIRLWRERLAEYVAATS